jgi:hypothetical protein
LAAHESRARRAGPRERKLDIVPPTLAEIDRHIQERIAAENESIIALMAENNVELKRGWVVGAMGPPGPSGPSGEQGPPGKLPLVKLWTPETVFYAGDVVAYDGGTFQAKRDTGQPPSHADWICLATAGRDGNSITVRGTFDESVSYRRRRRSQQRLFHRSQGCAWSLPGFWLAAVGEPRQARGRWREGRARPEGRSRIERCDDLRLESRSRALRCGASDVGRPRGPAAGTAWAVRAVPAGRLTNVMECGPRPGVTPP